MYIGNKLHALRKAKKISLTELSQQSGVQLATLSRIENMKMVGTLESHISIAKALGMDITELYRDIEKQTAVMDFSDGQSRTDIFTHSDHSSCEILTKNVLQKKMVPALLRIDPRGKTRTEQNRPGSEKFIFVLEGSIEADIDGKKFALNKSNTLYFDASLPHTFMNTGKAAAKALCVSTPVSV